jgi:ABC-type glycerol-3-phosphate transport system substrate-binding protein
MSTFQIVVTALFVAFIIVGVGVFASLGGVFGGGGVGQVVIWGTMDQERGSTFIDSMRSVDKSLQDVTYVEKDPTTYRDELLNAMASGTGPDLFLIPQEEMQAFADKILLISYRTVSQGSYVNSYVDAAGLLLTPQGALALPLYIDPLVMYWNRDIFASAGVAQAPKNWNDFITISPKITSLNTTQNFVRSTVALGEWQNVDNAKAILSTLFMQTGDQIISRAQNGALVSNFGRATDNSTSPAESALRFYTEFANPSKTTYSWNRSLPRSSLAFSGGELAVYFGFASEYASLSQRNPNLRFSVALMPQLTSGVSITYGRVTALAIPRSARNAGGAATVAQKLTSQQASSLLVQISGLASVRRDVPIDTSANAASQVFGQSALISRGWIDPNTEATDAIFKTMIESVVSGRAQPIEAVSQASLEFNQLLPRL